MIAVGSSTYDNQYIFFLPITRWCWNKIGVEFICFMPEPITDLEKKKYDLVRHIQNYTFRADSNKSATYAQVSRLYAGALGFNEDEVLITTDIDMIVFGEYLKIKSEGFDVFGSDLVPEHQIPMCYISATVKDWRDAMKISGRTYQQCLDDALGHENCENMRGNLWSRDQELAYNHISSQKVTHHHRARQGTQFATRRLDRDDAFMLDRLNHLIVDYHCHRPGFTDDNFLKIMTVLGFFYPQENFEWLTSYRSQYLSIIQ